MFVSAQRLIRFLSRARIIGGLAIAFLVSGASAQTLDLLQPYQRYMSAMTSRDYVAATRYGQQVLEIVVATHGAGSLEIVDSLERLGEVLALADQLTDATTRYEQALTIKERELGPLHPELIPTLEALADIAVRREKFAEAESLLMRIVEIERLLYGPQSENVIVTLNELRNLYERQNKVEDIAKVDVEIEAATFVARGFDPDPSGIDGRRYEAQDDYSTVRIFYGTNRARTGETKPAEFYGPQRGELEVGHVDVTIPKSHKYAELESESRWSVYSYFLGTEARKRHYVLLVNVAPLDQFEFQTQLRDHVRESPSNDILLLVHGYNSSFEDAARRVAQLAYDIDFDGTPMMYSWPSQASPAAYTVDEAVVRLSGRKMSRFIEDVVETSGAERIHLIAHSMGNRALIEALQAYIARGGRADSEQIFDQILLAAPDVDRDYFTEVIGDISKIAKRVTLYASDNDVALDTSKVVHGAPRAGQAGDAIIALPGLDTIDMSAVEADILGHAYFAANGGAIHDLFRLMWRGDPPPQRCGMDQAGVDQSLSWTFVPDNCSGTDLLQASVIIKRFGSSAMELVRSRIEGLTDPDAEASREEWQQILQKIEALLADESD